MASLALAFEVLVRDRASQKFKEIGRSAEAAGKKGEGLGNKMRTGLAVGIAAAGVAAVKYGADSIRAYADAEKSSARLDDALKKFPATTDRSRASFDLLNQSLAKKTRFDDDSTASGQAALAQFKLTGSQIQQLTPLLQDYAAKTGKDLPEAAQDLGKAMLGQGRALKAVGINFKDTGTAAGNFESLTAGLRTQVGGFAEVEGKTAAGQAAILGNRFGEIEETVGSKLVPILSVLGEKILNLIDWMENNQTTVKILAATVGGLAAALLIAKTVTLSIAAAQTIMAAKAAIITGLTKGYAAAQWLLNAALTANPIGIVVVAIGALVAGLVYAYKNSETFRTVVSKAFSVVKLGALTLAQVAVKAFQFLANVFMTVVGTILDGAASAFGWVPGLSPMLQGAAVEFSKFKTSANASLNKIQNDLQLNIDTETAAGKIAALHRDFVRREWNIAFGRTGGGGGAGGGGTGGSLGRPVSAAIGQPFGGRHHGIDFPAPRGTPVRAMIGGTVIRDGIDPGGFGIHLRTKDADGRYSIYGHLSRAFAGVGDRLSRGMTIGSVGSTGNSTGDHLHAERRTIAGSLSSAFDFTRALSFDKGGILPMGLSLVVNKTGAPEPLRRVDQGGGAGIHITNAHFHGVQDVPSMVRDLQAYAARNGGLRIKLA